MGAWVGEQLLVFSGTGVTIGEDLIVVYSWTRGVVFLVTVGVGLLSCACAVFDPHLPTENVHVTREPCESRLSTTRKRGCGVSHGLLEISCGG